MRYLTVGVAVVILKVCDRLSSSGVELSVGMTILRECVLGLGLANRKRWLVECVFFLLFWARTNVFFEVIAGAGGGPTKNSIQVCCT